MSGDINVSLEEGLKEVDGTYVQKVIDYLETKKDDVKHETYIRCYSIILYLSDAHDKAKELFDYFKKTVTEYIQRKVIPILQKRKDESFLTEFVRSWKNYTIFVHFMRKMFSYLDRYYLKNNNMSNLALCCLTFFKDKCFNVVDDQLKVAILHQISRERDGQLVDKDLLKVTIQTYVTCGFKNADIIKLGDDYVWKGDKNLEIYEKNFEKPLIDKSREEYQQKSTLWMSRLNCPEYLNECEAHLTKEEARADYILQPETKPKLMNAIHQEVIDKNAQFLVDKDTGCDQMFAHSKLNELALMFRIFKRVESTLKFIINKMNPYIEERGKKIVEDENLCKDPIEFTRKLLDLKQEMDEMLEKSFQNDLKFQKNRDMSFQHFMNQKNETPHFIASYCDNELRKGLKGLSEQQTEERIEAIIKLFCCLHSRDVFIKSYTKFLAGRLLNKTFLSIEAEEQMLQKLKVECGHNTVNKISQMFTDMQLSKDLMSEFKGKVQNGVIGDIEFSTEVLTNGHWPEQITSGCTLPQEMKLCCQKFDDFYKHKHSNRNLTWLYHHGTVEIVPLFTQKKFTFVVNCYQAVVLCLFNKNKEMTYSEIVEKSAIPADELNNALKYMCNPKNKILEKKNMKTPQFAQDEPVKVHEAYSNNNIRVQFVPTAVQKKKTAEPDERMRTDEKEIRQERQNIVDAAIVRTMKARKAEKYNKLLEDVVKQISTFMPQPQIIKQRIESLIEREYLKRDEADKTRFIYLP